ncbi:hypothetical protein pb186bvf_017009 [Paramecium bursaria]
MSRKRVSSKLPTLEITQFYKSSAELRNPKLLHVQFFVRNEVPIMKEDQQFRTFRAIAEQNSKMFNPNFTELPESSVNQSIVVELEHNRKAIEALVQLQKSKSDHEEAYKLLSKRMMSMTRMQRFVKQYPQKLEPQAYSKDMVNMKATVKRKVVAFHSNVTSYWYKADIYWIPPQREMSMAAVMNKKAYIFGGVGKEIFQDLLEYDIQLKKFQEIKNQNGDIPLARYGHCLHAITYQFMIVTQFTMDHSEPQISGRFLILFGGEMPFNSRLKIRENLNDAKLLNLDTMQWINLKPNIEGIPDSRKCFGSCIVARGLIVHGGLKSRLQIFDDINYLNLALCKWVKLEAGRNPFNHGIGFHQLLTIYQKPQIIFEKKDFRAKPVKFLDYEGLYCFGGCSFDKDKNTQYYDHFVYILRLDTHPPSWTIPDTIGQQPKGRIMHSANYLQDLNVVVIYGGRDDQQANPYFNDLYVYKLIEREWIKIETTQNPQPRAGHQSFNYGTRIMIMGGINYQGYAQGGVDIIEMSKKCLFIFIFYQIQIPTKLDQCNKMILPLLLDKLQIHKVPTTRLENHLSQRLREQKRMIIQPLIKRREERKR